MASKILVADDDPLLLTLIEHTLGAAGHTVLTAADGGEALDIARRERPDVVVLDAMMPVHDGIEVLGMLKDDPALKATPVVMLTMRKREEDIVGALRLGAADYMTKPFMPQELLARIERLLTARTTA
jgi:DNA-binding response OmpR family regulator